MIWVIRRLSRDKIAPIKQIQFASLTESLQLLPLLLRPLADLEMFSLQRKLRFFAISIGPVTEFVAVPRRFK